MNYYKKNPKKRKKMKKKRKMKTKEIKKIKIYIFVKLDAKLENLIQKQVGQNAIVQFKRKIQKQILMI